MSREHLISPGQLRQWLRYEPETGKLFWLPRSPETWPSAPETCRSWNTQHAGREALNRAAYNGYLVGTVACGPVRAHRVAWAIYHGEWPKGEIDHINGDRADNRLGNLRVVTKSENLRNTKLRTCNRSGHVGVSHDRKRGSFRAYITVNGKQTHLGAYPTLDLAIEARRKAEPRFGFHPNHGRRA